MPEQYLTTKDLAARWRMAPRSLTNLRSLGKGIPYVKLCGSVRYRLSDVLAHEQRGLIGASA